MFDGGASGSECDGGSTRRIPAGNQLHPVSPSSIRAGISQDSENSSCFCFFFSVFCRRIPAGRQLHPVSPSSIRAGISQDSENSSCFSVLPFVFCLKRGIIKGTSKNSLRRLFAFEQSPTGKIFGGYLQVATQIFLHGAFCPSAENPSARIFRDPLKQKKRSFCPVRIQERSAP